MYIRQLKTNQYDIFKKNVIKHVKLEPLNAFYQCTIVIDDQTYFLDFQLCSNNKILPLQAILINSDLRKCKLIDDPNILGALTELIIMRYGTKEMKGETA